MRNKITKKQLQRIVEQKVDEAWYNNIDDFYHGVGKAATIGGISAASLMGGAHILDKGLENQERYEQSLNQFSADQPSEYHYQKWCDQNGLDSEDDNNFERYSNEMNESKIRYMVRRAIVENYVRKELKRQITESALYTNDIDTSDLRVQCKPYNEDGYCEWEATCDNGWYSFRGTYSRGTCELDDVISGHSGYGHQHSVDDELRDWFYENLEDRVISEIEAQI